MEKKLWSNAEVVELGVESTKEDCMPTSSDKCLDKDNHTCKYCGQFFITHELKKYHEERCPQKPQEPVIPPLS